MALRRLALARPAGFYAGRKNTVREYGVHTYFSRDKILLSDVIIDNTDGQPQQNKVK